MGYKISGYESVICGLFPCWKEKLLNIFFLFYLTDFVCLDCQYNTVFLNQGSVTCA